MRRWTAALVASLLAAAPAHADALIDNVDGVALDAQGNVIRFAGVLIDKDGKVAKLLKKGDKRPDKLDWRSDMKGRVLIPGMIDAHGHFMELGFRALQLDLSKTRSLAEAQAAIAHYAQANANRPWIVGGGWNQEVWGQGFPTAADLDVATRDRPVMLARADGHAVWVNSAALKAAGITAKTPAPAGGRIEKLPNGQPSGVLVDAAVALVERHVPKPSPRERNAAFLKAQETLLANGITATADMGTTLDDWLTFRRMGDIGQLRLRIMSYSAGVDVALQVGGNGPTPWLYADKLRMGGVKLYADGALGSRGAWLKRPYADAPKESGLGFLADDQLLNLMSRSAMDGFQIAIHAIGDRANAQALDAIAEIASTYKDDRRWRIEHAQIVDPVDLPRFGQYGIIPSMQPVHQTSDRLMVEARLGLDRLAGAYAWASLLKQSGHLAFGSDYPVESPNPFVGWAAAFTRQDPQGQPAGGWQPQEAVTKLQAWRAFTTDAAYAGFADKRFGTLAPGMRADFLIVDRDPSEATPEALRDTRVLETWVGGEKMWSGSGGVSR
ncbi:amidohydrolase family protein [Sphingomonas sp. PL-96]|uniref:amidohydrolase n=1 Tax=Sphingomonas sp. PL-96 TaxID=2887201 RepID=UPI001E44F607|nr:amidohydrolase [Sphingomonas sp. PL-96]MCC2975732.1 amidohydrolase family protein [Sphingomonas sp. PL-96]